MTPRLNANPRTNYLMPMPAASSSKPSTKHQRGHLSRVVIAKAGLAVAREEGVHNLTMKRLAAELSVTPMAIYRHFEDKSDLIDAVLDRYVQESDICNHRVPAAKWAEWLYKTYTNMYHGLQSMPSVYPYLSTASRFGPGASEVVERTLETLQQAGFSVQRAMQAANALNGFVIGCAIMDSAFFSNMKGLDASSIKGPDAEHQNAPEPGLQTGLGLIISALKHEHKNIKTN